MMYTPFYTVLQACHPLRTHAAPGPRRLRRQLRARGGRGAVALAPRRGAPPGARAARRAGAAAAAASRLQLPGRPAGLRHPACQAHAQGTA